MRIEHIRTFANDGTYDAPTIRWIQSLAFGPGGRHLFVGDTGSKNVRIWDTESGALVSSIAVRLDDVVGLAVSPDGKRFAAAGSSGSVWDVASGKASFKLGSVTAQTEVAFSPDGELVACPVKKDVRIWSARDGSIVHKVKLGREVSAIAFAAERPWLFVAAIDGQYDYSASRRNVEGELSAIDLSTGKPVGAKVPLCELPSIAATSGGLLLREIPQITAKTGLRRGGPGVTFDPTLTERASIAVPSDTPTMSIRALRPLEGGCIATLELLGDDPETSPGGDARVVRVWDLAARTVTEAPLDPSVYGAVMKMAATPDGLLALASERAIHLARIVR